MKPLVKLKDVIGKNSHTILTGMAVGGVVGTTIMAVKDTLKAKTTLDEVSQYYEYDMTPQEVVKEVWKDYIPTAAMATATIVCMIGATTVSNRRNAALAGIYSITDTALKEYQAQVIETVGEKKAEEIKDKINEKVVKETYSSDLTVINTGKGDTLCLDKLSGRYFYSDIEHIRKAQNDINHDLISEMWMSLNDFYRYLEIEGIGLGEDYGWNVDNMVDLNFTSALTDDGTPVLVVDHNRYPSIHFRDF